LHFLQSNARYRITADKEIFVGRAASCEVDLTRYFNGQLQAVSRQHFKLLYSKGEGFAIVDLSYNGTQVNDEPLPKQKPRILRDGDLIKLARNENLLIRVMVDDDPDVTDAIDDPELLFPLLRNGPGAELYFDKVANQFVVNGQPIPHEFLTRLDVGLLTYLYHNTGRLCSFDEIAQHVWDDPAWAPENNTISRAITNLRKKLNQFSPGAGEYIQNIRGQGYKLVNEKE
jgi:pSer/pThr/pTyr-binding forkhead associated (FHA) protein